MTQHYQPTDSDNDAIARTYPHDEALEQAIIATALHRPAWMPALGRVSPDDFHLEGHRRIWAEIERQVLDGQTVSLLSLSSVLKGERYYEGLGGTLFLNDIAVAMCPFTEESARTLANRLRQLTEERRYKHALEGAHYDFSDNPDREPVAAMRARLVDTLTQMTSAEADMLRPAAMATERVIERAENAKEAPVLTVFSGLTDLDAKFNGFRAGEMHVMGGRPGMGKTIVGANIAINAALAGHGVAFFSLEMSQEQLAARMLCDLVQRGGNELWIASLRKGDIPRQFMKPLIEAQHVLDSIPLFIDDKRGQSLSSVAHKCRVLRRQLRKEGKDLELVVIDYLTLLEPDDRYRGQKVNEVTALSRGVKMLAGELEIPIIPLVQLNRQTESRSNKDNKPRLADIRESGSIEQDADSVTLLYREEYYVLDRKPASQTSPDYPAWQAELLECKDCLELNIAKNRDGETGVVTATVMARCAAVRDA